MKIGILTVHRAYNYGSVLQCYALQEVLKTLGHEVWIIDYRQRWTEAVYQTFSLYYIWHFLKIKDIHSVVAYWRTRKERKRNIDLASRVFATFTSKLNTTHPCWYRIPKGFDVYLVGSDQLWSHQCMGGEDKVYTGFFKHTPDSSIVGYAISSCPDSLYQFGNMKLKMILDNFRSISLREEDNSVIVQKMTGVKLPVTVDPVLLTTPSVWNSMLNETWGKQNFIAIYQARPVNGEPGYLKHKANIYANENNCDIVDLSGMTYSVEDFISIIKYAKCVITTSFHATVFSLIMETPCYAVRLNDGLDVRYVNLLTKIGLDAEIVEKDFMPVPLVVDFTSAKKRLAVYIQESLNYLRTTLA